MPWIAVDLDGTLAEWGTPESPMNVLRIGRPIAPMIERVRGWLAEGKDVRIFTARLGPASDAECLDALDGLECKTLVSLCGEAVLDAPTQDVWHTYQRTLIEQWCVALFGRALPVTATKDFHMIELWDDRCVQMVPNLGLTALDAHEALRRRVAELEQTIDGAL